MTDDKSIQSDTVWPLPKFYFKVIWDGKEMSFQDVSGLEDEVQTIEYRHGNNPDFSRIKTAEIPTHGSVTLKRGLFNGGANFWDWYSEIKMNTIKRVPIIISLCDESGVPKMTWTLVNCWPTKIEGADLKSDANEIAIECIEIVHEGITTSTP